MNPRLKPPRKPQQSAAYSSDDNLTEVSNPAVRRRVQNRLHQRAYRLRQKARREHGVEETQTKNVTAGPPGDCSSEPPVQHDPITCRLSEGQHSQCTFAPPNVHELMALFEKRAMTSYIQGSPNTDLLLNLSRLNVLRAAYQNVVSLGMTVEWMCEDTTISIFSLARPQLLEDSIPQSLRPTPLQRAVPHHPWLDIFPIPQMRDNLIRAGDSLDDDELCHDLTAFWDKRSSNATMLVWERLGIRGTGRLRRILRGSGVCFSMVVPRSLFRRIAGGFEGLRNRWFGGRCLENDQD